jgi:2-oxoglutarate dehydrogenase E1 component
MPTIRAAATGVPAEVLREIGEKITAVPAGFNVHKTIQRFSTTAR